jgi:malate permease and related proteins
MTTFLITLAYLAIGKILSRLPRFPAAADQVLSQYIIYVALPALVLLKIPELAFTREILIPVLLPWVMVAFSAALILAGSKFLPWNRETTGALLLLVPLGNTAFLGIPMVTAFFGEEAVPYALLYDQLGSFPALVIYGSVIVAIFGPAAQRPTPAGVLKRIITFPPLLALLLAIGLRPLAYPEILALLLHNLAATLVPVVMIAVGFRLTLQLSREVIAPLACGLAVKLVLAPAAALLLVSLLDLSGLPVRVSVFQAGMPPMVLAGVMAMAANLAPQLCAAMVGLGILVSFATLPVLFSFL